MAFQPVPNTAEVHIRFTLPGSVPAENQLHFTHDDPTIVDLEALVSSVDQYVAETFIPGLAQTITYRETYARMLNTAEDIQAVANESAGPGQNTNAALPNNVSFCLSLRSGLTGRSTRGRIYLMPPVTTEVAVGSRVLQSYADYWAGVVSGLASEMTPIGWTLVIVSRQSAGAIRPTGVTFEVTDVGYTDLVTDSQRRRLPGRGD